MMISKSERKLKKLLYAGNKAMTPEKNIFFYSSYSRGWERETYTEIITHEVQYDKKDMGKLILCTEPWTL